MHFVVSYFSLHFLVKALSFYLPNGKLCILLKSTCVYKEPSIKKAFWHLSYNGFVTVSYFCYYTFKCRHVSLSAYYILSLFIVYSCKYGFNDTFTMYHVVLVLEHHTKRIIQYSGTCRCLKH